MKKTIGIIQILLILTLCISLSQGTENFKRDFLVNQPLNKERLHLLPVPADWRNYFVLQSIGDTTNIIIGDFLRPEINITLVADDGSDGKVDKIIEFFPGNNKYEEPYKPSSKMYSEFTQMKKDIVEGVIFKNNYAHQMKSLEALKKYIKMGRNIYKSGYGYTVKVYDPDRSSSIMSEFLFVKNLDGRCDLVFTTYYYDSFRTIIAPEMFYSVYCKNSKDPYVLEVVESLYKMIGQ